MSLSLSLLHLTGCQQPLSPQDVSQLSAQQLSAAATPASPTNKFADNAAAAELGRHLFFDKRMSADGTISCASCHLASEGFSNSRPHSLGVRGQEGGRHSLPATSVAFHPFLFWDGRADSLWSQPLQAIENPKEMDFSRLEVAHFVQSQYGADYEAVFGPLPALAGLPARAEPGMAEWTQLSATQQDQVQRVFANVGKAIEAYERQLSCSNTRFDQWQRGEVQLTATEQTGARAFVQNGCIRCHSGPSFSDGKFHNLGLGAGDNGRTDGITKLLASPFNGAGVYSDDRQAGALKLEVAAQESNTDGQFRTASLRGVGQREFFGHTGQTQQLDDFIQNTYRGRGGRNNNARDPLLQGVRTNDLNELVTFLHTLDCPALPAQLQAP
jgi:cytochrome c peroxidase